MAPFRLLVCCVLLFFPDFSDSIPEPGKETMIFEKDGEYRGFSKALYKGAIISAKGKCSSKKDKKPEIKIQWKLKYTQCAEFFIGFKDLISLWNMKRQYELSGTDTIKCTGRVTLTDRSSELEYIEPPTTKEQLNSTAKTLGAVIATLATKKQRESSEEGGEQENETNDSDTRKNPSKSQNQPLQRRRRGAEDDSEEENEDDPLQELNGMSVRTSRQHRKTTRAKPTATKPVAVHVTSATKPRVRITKKHTRPTPNKAEDGEEEQSTLSTTIKTKLANDHKVDSNPHQLKMKKKTTGTNRVTTTRRDGIYMLIVKVENDEDEEFHLELEVSMESKSGYLSATDWPLLPFFGVMSLVYLFYGIVWLIVSACQWRDLLRIQFWIGGVIALGMLEKAVFYSEYNNINHTGIPTPSLVVFAEVVSVAKRTLARMLVIIVSMGFGIVKPRLGKSLHRVLGVGALYFILGIVEGCMRSLSLKADPSKEQLVAGIPLAVLDAAICWWIFMSLVQTTRTLRIRRNIIKLSLYRHFTNTLIFAVLASVAYMIWSIKTHRFADCLKDWSELWLDEAFWHFLFSILLLVIMVLWRPTANNQRYAFTPIVDFDDDEDDNVKLSEAFDGMKMRNTRTEVVVNGGDSKKKAEDDLKWVEENIPSSAADTVLPSVLDSDEELMTTKFEMSKMD